MLPDGRRASNMKYQGGYTSSSTNIKHKDLFYVL